jgi:hypothetical protein
MYAFQIRRMIAVAGVAALPTIAAALPAVSYEQSASETGFFTSTYYPNDTLYQVESDGSPAYYNGSTASAALSPYPAVYASSSTGVMEFPYFGTIATPPYLYRLSHRAESELVYDFTVNGPSQAIVPLTATFNLTIGGVGFSNLWSATASGQIRGELSCVGGFGPLGACSAALSSNPAVPYVTVVSFTTRADDIDTVILDAQTSTVQTSPDQSSAATAYADPYIVIDPTWLAANPGYSLSFSPGIVNAGPGSAAPEPASWALMLSGFGLVGGAMRRRQAGRALAGLAG